MDQIRQLRFEDFRDEKLEQGYQEVLERSWVPDTENEMHHHEFTAEGIVIQGEFWLTTQGKTQHLQSGDSSQSTGAAQCQRPTGGPHWAGKRLRGHHHGAI